MKQLQIRLIPHCPQTIKPYRNMTMKKITLTFTAIAITAVLAGCNKQETDKAAEATKDAAAKTEGVVEKATDAVKNTVDAAKDTGAKVVEDVKKAGTEAVATVTEKVKDIAAPASAKAQELIDSAKGLFTEGKFSDALAKLKDASSASPSTEQQGIIDTLKAQIEKAMAAASKATTDATKSATDAVNNLLKK